MHSKSLGVLALDVAHHVRHIGGEKGASGARIMGAGVLVLVLVLVFSLDDGGVCTWCR